MQMFDLKKEVYKNMTEEMEVCCYEDYGKDNSKGKKQLGK